MSCTFVVPPSTSKLRRQRDSRAKQKLYCAAQSQQPLMLIHSQLAMLTSSIDIVLGVITPLLQSQYVFPTTISSSLNPGAEEYHPWPSCEVVALEETIVEQAGDASGADEANPVLDLVGDWQDLDPWLFLDRLELQSLSQTCKENLALVGTFTPFMEMRSSSDPSCEMSVT